jgi:two-component system chemotaxis response regulator CheY
MLTMRILVAEDDRACNRAISKMLAGYGEVVSAVDGQEAIDEFFSAHKHGHPFGLICLDIKMPHKTGREVLQEIRHFERENSIDDEGRSTVLMTTGLSKYEDVKEAFRQQCDGYVVKPIETGQLNVTLTSLGISKSKN